MQKIIDLALFAALLAAVGSTVLASQQGAQLHDNQYPDVDIAHGAGLYTARCAPCHGAQGDGIGGVNLRSGKFRNAITDRDLAGFIRAGSPAAGMPPFALDDTDMAGIIAYLRNMNSFDAATVKTGNLDRGRALFEGKGTCTKCHRVGRLGSHVGPNLTDIGSVRSAGSLQRSLLEPASQMMPINRPVRLVTKDGTVINGRRLNEDTYSIQIMDEHERLHSVQKADLREFTILKASPMPSYKDMLSSEELADLLGYLLSLKGQ
jgi:putative heme-binding domain-containing protein